MKRIVINVENAAYECVAGVLQLCKGVEIVSDEDLQGIASNIDECFAKAIRELQAEGVVRNQYDYAFIYMAIREDIICDMEPFYSVQSFVDYLVELGISNPPSKNSIANICTHTQGVFPDWLYDEPVDATEVRRRKNVVMRFSSCFSRLLRELGR